MANIFIKQRHTLSILARLGLVLLLVTIFSFQLALVAYAAGFTVTKPDDTNDGFCNADCSLREAIVAANITVEADVITVPAGIYTLVITGRGEDNGATGDLDIARDLTINGAGAKTTIIQAGVTTATSVDRVFHIRTVGITVNINDVTIQNGLTITDSNAPGFEDGGGIYNNGGILNVNNSIISNNVAFSFKDAGGGIANTNNGTLNVRDSAIIGNSAVVTSGFGGGIFNNGGATANIINSTFSGNSAERGGGIQNEATAFITNSTFVKNSATITGSNIRTFHNAKAVTTTVANTLIAEGGPTGNCDDRDKGTTVSNGYNIEDTNTCNLTAIGDLPNATLPLGSLQDNGGETYTIELLPGNPAINHIPINISGCNTTITIDQRGIPRPQIGSCDVGAYEAQPDLEISKTNNVGGGITLGNSWDWTATITNTDGATATFAAGQTIISDTLPGSNISYGAVSVVNDSNIINSGNITCTISSNTLTCKANAGSVGIGGNGAFGAEFTATPGVTGTFTNPAIGGCMADPGSVITETNESNNACNSDSVVVTVPDLEISKANNVGGATTLGNSWDWTVTITNTDTGTATFAAGQTIISDTLPGSNISYGAVSVVNDSKIANSGNITCTISSNTLTCKANAGSVGIGNGGGTFGAQVTATPSATGTFTNPTGAGCLADPGDVILESNESNNACNSDSVVVTAPNLKVSKANDVGGNTTLTNTWDWTLTISNTGDAAATFNSGQTIISDTLPSANVSYGGVSTSNLAGISGSGGISCSVSGGNLFACTANGGTVAIAAGTGSFQASVTATPLATGVFTNPTGICLVDPDGNITESDETDNNCNNDAVDVAPEADLGVSKMVSNNAPSEGDTIAYTVVVSNAGPSTATGIVISDTLPAGVTFNSASETTGGSFTAGPPGVWMLNGSLTKDAVATLTLTVTVKSDTAGQTITNTAAISTSDQFDGVTSNNTKSVTFTVKNAELELTKLVYGPTGAAPGNSTATVDEEDTITYTIVVTNNGPNTTSGTIISDILPGGVTFGSQVSASSGSYNGATWAVNDSDFTATEAHTLIFTATVDAGTASQTIANKTGISSSADGDTNSINNASVATITVRGADLELSKQVTPLLAPETDTITYTIVVTNNGLHTADNVFISDTLPTGITFGGVVGTPSQGSYTPGTSGVWDVGNLTNGLTATVNFTATVNAGTAGQTLVNTAAISSSQTKDPVSGNNVATASLTVASFDLAITKEAVRDDEELDGVITYTVTIVNNGPTSAPGAIISDTEPAAGVNFDSWSCAASGGAVCPTPSTGSDNIIQTTGEFPSGGKLVYTIRATLPSSDTVVTNTAIVTSPNGLGDTKPDNNEATHVSQPDSGGIYLPIIIKNG